MASPCRSGYSALSRGRYSATGEEYFLTFNLQRPQRGLHDPVLLFHLRIELSAAEVRDDWTVRTGVIMPDHVHLLVRSGHRSDLAEAVRGYKGRLAPALRKRGLNWQHSFFDHRLRLGEDALPVFLYIFLNPYRANLIPSGDRWPGYFCAADDWEWFGQMTDLGTPLPEWLADR